MKSAIVKICLAASLAFFLILIRSNSVLAQTPNPTYGANYCKSYDPLPCPPGTSRGTDINVGTKYNCINYNNKFCEILTGSPNIVTDDTIFKRSLTCDKPLLLSVGTCNNNQVKIPDQAERNILKEGKLKYFFSQDAIDLKLNLSFDDQNILNYYDNKGGNATAPIGCSGTNQPTIPNDSFFVNGLGDYFSATPKTLQALYNLTNDGFPLIRNNSDPSIFCPSQTQYYAGYPYNKCYDTNLNQRPCLIKDFSKPGSLCIKGLSNDFYDDQRDNKIVNIYYTNNVSNGVQLKNDTKYIVFGKQNDISCQKNTKDYFQERSNKGCSDFITSNADGTLTQTTNYPKCLSCLYGDNPRTSAELINDPTLQNDLSYLSILKDGKTLPLNMENEPYGKPISGMIFSDVGCLNTNSTSSIVNSFVRLALGVMGGLVILRIIQGALIMQQADPESFQEGKDIITSALIAMFVLIFSAVLLNFIGINILQLGNKGFPTFGGGG